MVLTRSSLRNWSRRDTAGQGFRGGPPTSELWVADELGHRVLSIVKPLSAKYHYRPGSRTQQLELANLGNAASGASAPSDTCSHSLKNSAILPEKTTPGQRSRCCRSGCNLDQQRILSPWSAEVVEGVRSSPLTIFRRY